MKQIGGIVNIVFGLIVLSLAYYGLSKHFGGTQDDIERFSKLLNEGETTMAVFDSTYTELKVKKITSYIFEYTFKVDGKDFRGEHTFESIDEINSPLTEIRYLKTNPEINGLQLEKQLAEAKEDSESNMDLILGLGALLIGSYFIFSGMRRFRRQEVGNGSS